MKTSELIGPALDWAVAKCEGLNPEVVQEMAGPFIAYTINEGHSWVEFRPSTDWSQGGPIIERELIGAHSAGINFWKAGLQDENSRAFFSYGPTPLIAAMRCYVASKLGDEVELPDELK